MVILCIFGKLIILHMKEISECKTHCKLHLDVFDYCQQGENLNYQRDKMEGICK